MPRISIFTPTYNAEKFLASTIESVLRQTFKDWELIIMDGGSKDKTLEIARGFAKNDPRIKIYSEKDEGAWHAICKCAAVATGDFICFMPASDGYVNDRWYEECIKTVDAHPEVSLVWGVPFEINEDGSSRGPHFVYAHYLAQPVAGSRVAMLKEIGRRIISMLSPRNLMRMIRKLSVNRLRTVVAALRPSVMPREEEWFFYWLKTGHFFPDANMFFSRQVYLDCSPKYVLGSKVQGGYMEIYYNFNARGYLSYGLPIPANYGRHHSGQLNVVLRRKNDEYTEWYMNEIAKLRMKLRDQKEMIFIGRDKKPVKRIDLKGRI